MMARPQKVETPVVHDSFMTRAPAPPPAASAEPVMSARTLDAVSAEHSRATGRKLRNLLILANVVGWFGIFLIIRMIFF